MLPLLAKDSVIYGVANLIQKLVPFLIIPIITNYYGGEGLKLYDVSFVYAYLFSWLIILGQDSAASIFFFSTKDEDHRKRVLLHGLLIQFFFFLVVASLFFPVKNSISSYLFPTDKTVGIYWLKALLIIPGHILLNYVQNILIWKEKKREYIVLGLTQVLLSISTVLLTVKFEMGIEGIFNSLIFSITATSIAGVFFIYRSLTPEKLSIDKNLIKQLIIIGLPFALTSFFHQLVPSIDRFFLFKMGIEDEMPDYVLAVKIGGLITMATSAFILAFTPFSMKKIYEKDGESHLSFLFRIVSICILISVPLILLFKDLIIRILADSSYTMTDDLLPFFFFGWVFDLFFYFSILGVYKSKKSYWMLIFFACSVLIITILNSIMVPLYGVFGAAASFCITKILSFVLPLVFLKNYFKLSINILPFLFFVAIAIFTSFMIYQLNHLNSFLLAGLVLIATFFYVRDIYLKGISNSTINK